MKGKNAQDMLPNGENERIQQLKNQKIGIEADLDGIVLSGKQSNPDSVNVVGLVEETQETFPNIQDPYRRLVDRLPVISFTLDADGTIQELDGALLHLMGYTPEEVIGKNWEELFFPGPRKQNGQKVLARLKNGDVSAYEVELSSRTGDPITLLLETTNSYSTQGGLEKVVGIGLFQASSKDAPNTEQGRQSISVNLEERIHDLETANAQLLESNQSLEQANTSLKTMLQSLPVGVWIADQNGQIIEKNEMGDQIWRGSTPLSKSAENYGEYVAWWAETGEQVKPEEWGLARALQRGEKSLGEKIDILRYDGSIGTVINSATPVYDSDGKIVGAIAINTDITHERRLEQQVRAAAEEARRKAEEFSAVFQAMADAVIVFDAQGVLTAANPAAMLVYKNNPIGKNMDVLVEQLQLSFPDGRLIPRDELPARRAMRGELVRNERLRLVDPKGNEIITVESASPLYNSSGEMLGVVVVWRDITEREKLLHQLAVEHDKLDKVIESIRDEVWVIDAGGKVAKVNQAAFRHLTWTKTELQSESYSTLISNLQIFDEKGELRSVDAAPLLRSLRGEWIEGIEESLIHPGNGETVYRQVNSAPLTDGDGNILGAIAVIQDVTPRKNAEKLLQKHLADLEKQVQYRTRELTTVYEELIEEIVERKQAEETLRQSEERFRMVVESVRDYAIFALNPEGFVASWNAGAEAIKGYREDEIVGKHYSCFYPPEQIEAEVPQLTLKYARENGRHEIEGWRVRKDGTQFWANIVITALRDESGQLRGYAKVVRDVTRRKEAERALERQTGFVRLLQEVAVAANQANHLEEAVLDTLERVCQLLGWQIGHAWKLEESGSGTELVSMGLWYPLADPAFRLLQETTGKFRFPPGEGLPGKVFELGEPLWLTDIDQNQEYWRREAAAACGLKTSLALPILTGDRPVAILEFFTSQELAPEADLVEVLTHIGTQLGRVFERQISENALRQSEARFRTIFENAPLGIELVDLEAGSLACNPALVDMLGMGCEELDPDWLIRSDANWLSIEERFVTGSRMALARQFMEELRQGEISSYRLELPLHRKGGKHIWGRLTVSRLPAEDQEAAPLAIAMVEDITERKQMEADLAELKHRQIEGREMERLQLSQELHDGPLQDLYGVSFNLKAFSSNLPDQVDPLPVRDLQENLHKVVQTLRAICGDLRPPTLAPFGLEKAIRSHAETFRGEHPEISLGLELMADGQSLPANTRLALYRIYQHSLTNVIRHAQARQVLVRLILKEEEVRLEISDDGRGFELPQRWIDLARKGHLGLVGAQERAEALGGYLTVETAVGSGTVVRAVVPRRKEGHSDWNFYPQGGYS